MPTYLSPGVYVEEEQAGSRPIEGVGTAVAAFVGIAEKGPLNLPTLVSSWTEFQDVFGSFTEDAYLAHAVQGYYLNGGGLSYVVRIGEDSGPAIASAEISAPTAKSGSAELRYEAKALASAELGERLEVEIGPAVAEGDSPPADDAFKLIVRRAGKVVEEFNGLSPEKGKSGAATAVTEQSELIELVDVRGASAVRPADGRVALEAPSDKLVAIEPAAYLGDVAERSGIGGLEAIDEITMLAVPDLMTAYEKEWIDIDGVKAVQDRMITHCEQMGDRMAILDTPPDLRPDGAKNWRKDGGFNSAYAAMYWPWLKVSDPATGSTIEVPPSGHMAGVWGRSDDTRGVHKAPANFVVRGSIGLASSLTSKEQELLNPIGVNCIRSFPSRGINVWGARTLADDPAWRYLNVRRLFNYLEESILGGTQWVVFEPNDDALWARIRRTISDFLVNEWRKGALFGTTPDEAYFVKCDRETNTAESIDAGQVICLVGVAPVKPAEFVIFRLSQFSGGASLTD